jgi:hypothetical protein
MLLLWFAEGNTLPSATNHARFFLRKSHCLFLRPDHDATMIGSGHIQHWGTGRFEVPVEMGICSIR